MTYYSDKINQNVISSSVHLFSHLDNIIIYYNTIYT